ncbi:TonB-dependent siderophore receptor [Iningainema tapete]|uniref:TonB-dependent siderophore receptor n=1 Tax=Iningainema tapete BLCC-T55 TaxID=2748662 RepID=A0A8J7C4M8_9CYAN|nr:TonB-dependent siderophore receptor [Iningainema tapete]MBD2771749.1 TonB-dependent siderophore receptor [Iningainema tapete BLCC-T55]
MKGQLQKVLLLVGSVWVLSPNPVFGQEVRSLAPNKHIRRLSEIQRPIASARLLVQSPTPEIVSVTGVKANPTNKGVEIILQTAKGSQLQIANRSTGNSFIADITNAQLRLPSGNTFIFRSEQPIAGITEITVINSNANTIQVRVTGEATIPVVELFDSPDEGLIFSVASTAPAKPQPQPQTQPQPEQDQPESQTQPKPSASGDEPIELVVTGELDAYRVTNATTATKTDTPIRDIPASIQVIPRQVLEDQKAVNLIDAIRNVSGVSLGATGGLTSFPNQFTIRGFTTGSLNGSNYVNGLRLRGRLFSETANIEQVEVLKGPASVLYGQAEPGGIINTTTKQPLAAPYYAAELTVGSYDFYRPAIDISGPLNTDKTARYRLNAAYRTSGSFVDFVDAERIAIAPVFSFDLGKNTTLTLEADYQRSSIPDYDGLPAVGTVLPNPFGRVPKSRFIDDPKLENQRYNDTLVGYRLQHKFSDNWSVRNAFNAEIFDVDEDIISPALAADNRTVTRTAFRGTTDAQYYTLQTDLIGKVTTGSIKHDLLFGFDLFWASSETIRRTTTLPSLNLFNPIYERSPVQFITKSTDIFDRQNIIGVYAQNLISLTDNLKILLGGRFDWVDQSQDNRLRLTNTTVKQNDSAFSPRVGIIYQPIKPVSLYASYSRSFLPAGLFTINADNTPFKPTKGEQYEVGVKTEFLDGRLSATIAAYQITKQNIVVPDPTPGRSNLSIQIGEQQSKGIELDIVGQPIPGLNLIATYSYTDAEFTQDTRPNFQGNQPNNVPRHSASLWATYEIQSGGLKGLGFGGGLFFVGDRKGDLANTFTLPSYVRTDTTIFYRRNNWRVGLNFKNLFDLDYFESARDRNAVFYGEPFTVLGTFSVSF